jgi:hypothetical protein
MKRFAWIAVLLFGLVVSMSGQTTPAAQATAQKPAQQTAARKPDQPVAATQKPDQPAVEQPADFKAFNEASKTSDPKKRIEALQKFMTDFPDSMLVGLAKSQMRDQLTRSVQDGTKALLSEIDKSIETNTGNPFSAYASAATTLLRAGILLEEAEKLAEKGLAANTDPQKYVEQARVARAKPKTTNPKGTVAGSVSMMSSDGVMTVTWTPPRAGQADAPPRPEATDDDARALYRSQRAQLQTTLAQIYMRRGKNADAEKLFKDVHGNPDVPSSAKAIAVRELANFARKAGDDKALVQYLMDSVIEGARPDVHKELRDVYKKTHNGSLDGLESTLDAMYEKSLPKIDVKPFDRPKTVKDPRVVLAELFTGSECPPCVGIDLAFDAAFQRYKPEDFAFLVYHQHIPGPDPMTNPPTQQRKDFYSIRGVPTHYIDGKTDGAGGGGADQAERYYSTRIKPDIELAMGVPPEAKLNLTASMVGSTIRVKASVASVASKSDKLRLQIVLAEPQLRFHGGNGIRFHPMVVRSIASVPIKPAAAAKQAKAATQPTANARQSAAADGEQSSDAVKAPTAEQGFAIPQGKGLKIDYVFDLAKITTANRAFIDDFLTKPFRGGDKPTFSSRMDDIDPRQLVVVAFVQDEDPKQGSGERTVNGKTVKDAVPLRHILQAASVKIGPGKTTN